MKTKINKVIKVLILSDLALVGGLGFVSPIFAIFLTERIRGGSIETVGYVSAIYWIIIALTVIPFGKYLDKNHGEKDDFWFVVIGNVLAALAVLGYLFSSVIWHIYIFHIFYAFGISMNMSAYGAIFTRHIDKGKEALSWSTRAALIGAGTGTTGALGGIIAARFGFETLFIGIFIIILLSAFLPFVIYKKICYKDKQTVHIPTVKI